MKKHILVTLIIIFTVIISFVVKNTLDGGILYGLALSIVLALTYLSIILSIPQFSLLLKLRKNGFKAEDKATRIKNFVKLIELQSINLSSKQQTIITVIGALIILVVQTVVNLNIENKELVRILFEVASCIAIIFFFLSSFCQFEIKRIVMKKNK